MAPPRFGGNAKSVLCAEAGISSGFRTASSNTRTMSSTDLQTASRWVDDHGECLYRYALVRVRKPDVAEDLLVGILKNKIVDHFRKLGRETSFTDMEFLSEEFSEKFVPIGFWNHDLGPHE